MLAGIGWLAADAGAETAVRNGAGAASVPEPASLSLLGLAGLGLLRRRRRS